MPTHVEPFGISFLEVVQAWLLIVGTRVGAVSGFFQNSWNGFIVVPGDGQGIAQTLMNLLYHPDPRREFGERGFAQKKDSNSTFLKIGINLLQVRLTQ